MATREFDGETWSGTEEQLDMEELGRLFHGQKVNFPTERGERVGKVISHYSPRSSVMQLEISYRGGIYWVDANDTTNA